jgi:hypothetical protein
MSQIVRVRRRIAGATGAPDNLLNAEMAFNEVSGVLYYGAGLGVDAAATDIIEIGGPGAFLDLQSDQTVYGEKTFADVVLFTSEVQALTPPLADNSNTVATTAFVRGQNFATLVNGLIPAEQLPSYVDDVVEYGELAQLPGTGVFGKIYVTLDNGKIYRWSGSAYVEIIASPGTTDAIVEGVTNLFLTPQRVYDASPVKSVAGRVGEIVLTSIDVGLDLVDNTADLDKPISTAVQFALDAKADLLHTHVVSDVAGLSATITSVVQTLAQKLNANTPIDGNTTRLLHKRSDTADYVPSASDLLIGELIINYADGRIFIKKQDSTVLDVTEPLYTIDGGLLVGTAAETSALATESGDTIYTENFRRIIFG